MRPCGIAIVDVLIEGATCLQMFGPDGHWLFAATELPRGFNGRTP